MSDPKQPNQQVDVRDGLELAPDEVADLEPSPVEEDEVRGGNCYAKVKPDVTPTRLQ